MARRKLGKLSGPEFYAVVDARCAKRMADIDAMPAEIRAVVHDYGFSVVTALRDCGVTQARHMRHIVETVLNEFSPTRGAYSSQGTRAIREGEPVVRVRHTRG